MKNVFVCFTLLLLISACSLEQPIQEPVKEIENEPIEEVKETSPIIKIENDTLKTELNKPIDLLSGVSAIDSKGNKLKVEVSGQYYFNVAGVYKLEYIAKDSNNLTAFKRFTLTVNEAKKVSSQEILCKDDPENGTAPDTPYEECDYVFPDDLKVFEENAVMQFDPNNDGWKQCALEAQKYDKTIYVTDCFALLDNIRNTARVGLWVSERDNNVDRQLFLTFTSMLPGKYKISETVIMSADLIGAIKGYKYIISDDIKPELYLFDKDSEAYSKIKETGKITLEGYGDFEIIMNGYYGLINQNVTEDIIFFFKSID